ncbi:hypothetical protein LUZ60_016889 [Juncus effusus]|nr:hypothetical protein LUZ60_016889 [Juncus effusus]
MLLRSSLSPRPPPPLPSHSRLSPFLLLKPPQQNSPKTKLKQSTKLQCNSFAQVHSYGTADSEKNPKKSTKLHCNSISQVHSYGTVDFEKKPGLLWSALYRRVLSGHREGRTPAGVLDEWDETERRLTKYEVCRVAKELRKYRHFHLALDVYEWMAAREDRFSMKSADMAIQLDLIGKVRGTLYAEQHFSSLSESFKDKRTFCSLLNMYAQAKLKEKAESLFQLMHENNYITDTLPYNVMMTLYLNLKEHENVERIIREMREKNMDFDIYTYNIWISNVAGNKSLDQMEEILKIMESDNVNANWTTYTTLASMYIKEGIFEKAESCIKEAEMRMTGRNRSPFHYFMTLYGNIGKKDEVYRIWNWYKTSFPSALNAGYKSMFQALIKLNDLEGAELLYEEWLTSAPSFDPRISQILMSWYCNNGFTNKGEEVVVKLAQKGGKPNCFTWEILVYGFVKERNVNMALSYLEKAVLNVISDPSLKWRPKVGIIGGLFDLCEEMDERESLDKVVSLLKKGGWSGKEPLKGLIERYV